MCRRDSASAEAGGTWKTVLRIVQAHPDSTNYRPKNFLLRFGKSIAIARIFIHFENQGGCFGLTEDSVFRANRGRY
jgi:hypothetical protein